MAKPRKLWTALWTALCFTVLVMPGCGNDEDPERTQNRDSGVPATVNDSGAPDSMTGHDNGPGNDCDATNNWSSADLSSEDQVLTLVNRIRASGTTCGEDTLPPVDPLSKNVQLRCAARAHSLDMRTNDYFAHESPDGENASDRVNQTTYAWTTVGENIATGYPTPEAVMEGWLNSPGHCRNILSDNYVHIGVGYAPPLWTQVFAAPR